MTPLLEVPIKSSSSPLVWLQLFIFSSISIFQHLHATMSWHPETNPHFIKTPLQQREGQHSQTPPSPRVSRHQDQQNQSPHGLPVTEPRSKGKGSKRKGASVDRQKHEGQHEGQFHTPWMTPGGQHPDQYPRPHFSLHDDQFLSPQQDQHQHSQPHFPLHDSKFQSPWVLPPPPQSQHPKAHGLKDDGQPHIPAMHQDQDRRPKVTHPQHEEHGPQQSASARGPQGQDHDGYRHSRVFGMPRPRRTKPITWLGAVFCVIFWIVIFLGGLIILIVYLVYRPRSPQFNVSSATLNAAYMDTGSLLNSDLSLLANFTNPNKKVSVDFSYMIIDLYYGSTLIATQYIEPFSAAKAESRFQNVHMVTSQVQLPMMESQRLQEQISKNGVVFNVKGVFRVRSKLGSLLRYSYRLYGHCTIMVTGPPSGVLRATKCRTKR